MILFNILLKNRDKKGYDCVSDDTWHLSPHSTTRMLHLNSFTALSLILLILLWVCVLVSSLPESIIMEDTQLQIQIMLKIRSLWNV